MVHRIGDRAVFSALAWAGDGSFLIGAQPGNATIWTAEDWEPVLPGPVSSER